ncbi:MAG: type II toxin-antitoxin system VapC family toxin [Acidobacteriota bacterium]
MRFWDSSALVPLLVEEETTASLDRLASDGREIAVWWGSEIECASAIARLERSQDLTTSDCQAVFEYLEELSKSWYQIDPINAVKSAARRFLRVHDLRAADSLQLAAALAAAEGQPPSLEFVCLDERLVTAARREGFRVIDRQRLQPASSES